MKLPFPETPRCPFCNQIIEPPKELRQRKPNEFPVGICEHCGAVYAYDVSGKNRGAAFLEALLFACNYDWDLCLQLSPGKDYEDAWIEHYDGITHTVVPTESFEGRSIPGVLIFVKTHKEIQEVTQPVIKEKIKEALPKITHKICPRAFSKKEIRKMVMENKVEEIISLAEKDTRVVTELQRMLYVVDESLRWRTIEILGKVSERVADKRPDVISKLLYRLLYSTSDSAASAWGAIEAAATIISYRPDIFADYVRSLFSFFLDKELHREVTWAIGRIAGKKPELVRYAFSTLCSFLKAEDPVLRGYAVWALGEMKNKEAIKEIKALENDNHFIRIYKDGEVKEETISQLVKEATAKLEGCL